jgi:hypothetical protein
VLLRHDADGIAAASAQLSAGMLDEGVLPPGLTLLSAGTYGLPCK